MAGKLIVRYSKTLPGAICPRYAHGPSEDAGMDLFAATGAELEPHQWKSLRTGISVEIPPGYEGQVRPRSGLARRHGLTLLNSPGTIDPGFRGEIQVTLINFGSQTYHVRAGDRIAQLVLSSYASVEWELSETLAESERGTGGFGSTGR